MMKRSLQRGYTAVEVLSAMMLLAIGASGVIGMQKITVQGGTDARRFDIAANIAHTWTERLQRDSALWTQPNSDPAFAQTTNIAGTKWVKDVLNTPTCTANWCKPAGGVPASGIDSSAYDVLGRDLPTYVAGTGTDAFFCVYYRLNWVMDNLNGQGRTGLIRAEVLVFWQRLEYGAIASCDAPPVAPDDAVVATRTRYHYIHATTSLRENAQQ
jgi:prepilin-type N-terminal cleavage/methylation domain-containing protein